MEFIRIKLHLKFLLLSGFIFLGTLLQAQGSDVKISIDRNDISIKEALREVEKQSNMSVAYNESKLQSSKKIALNVKDKSLDETLDAILNNTGYVYKIENDHIMIVSQNAAVGQAEKKIVKGRILDETNSPLPGATISVQGTTTGTITDFDGNYSIEVSKGDVLVISYLGYTSRNVTVGDANSIDMKMHPSSRELDAVVITALGIKREAKALSYNVQQVDQDAVMRNKDVNFINSLAGKVAGVTINSSSAGVGGASKVVMRGPRSIEQSSTTLYVIDGIPMYDSEAKGGMEHDSAGSTESIADINPEDIESMSVLNGAAASALYGYEAANGAILITTKKGKVGRTVVTIGQNTDFRTVFVGPKFQNSYGTGIEGMLADGSDRSWGPKLNAANYIGYSPQKDYLRTGVVATESFTLSTGSDKSQTYLSAAAINSSGIVPNNDYDRYNFTFRNTTSFLNDKMTLDAGVSYIKQKDQNMTNQGEYSNSLISAYLYPRGDSWESVKAYEVYDSQRKINVQNWPTNMLGEFTGQNPYWINYRNMRTSTRDRYMLHATLSYDIFDWLNVTGRVRTDHTRGKYEEKFYATTNTTLTRSDTGLYGITENKNKQLYADAMVNINKRFYEDFSLHANIGVSMKDIDVKELKVRGPLRSTEIMPPGVPNVFSVMNIDHTRVNLEQGGYGEETKSAFASVELGYKNAYYLTLTGRNDWPSQLAGPHSNKSSFFYPSIGASVLLSEIIALPKSIEYAKVRASFASIGLPFPRGLAFTTQKFNPETNMYEGKSHFPMSNLKAERSDSWEVGLTVNFLKNFRADLSLYHTKSYNQTVDARISASSGSKTLWVQTGSVRNQGVEFLLGYEKRWNDFSYSTSYTLTHNQNKILKLLDNIIHPETGELIEKDQLTIGGLNQAKFILKKGGTLGDLYSLSDLQKDANGHIYVDENGNVQVNTTIEEPIKLGSVLPKVNMGWNHNFSWKGFNLGLLFTTRIGGIVYSPMQAIMDLYGVSETSADARDRGGVLINGGNSVDPEKWYTAVGSNKGVPQLYTYSATNVRLQEASIGYTFSKSQLFGIANEATISVVGRNLWMIYNRAPYDPETIATTGNYYTGIDNFMNPSTRNIGFNVQVKF